mmetsp:Transcript_24793/g.54060  ORF Transcript_24793/g.54060 Transcript_24793/m.54060 type:complete len:237 (+) Transcript_24793:1611-2321(+)
MAFSTIISVCRPPQKFLLKAKGSAIFFIAASLCQAYAGAPSPAANAGVSLSTGNSPLRCSNIDPSSTPARYNARVFSRYVETCLAISVTVESQFRSANNGSPCSTTISPSSSSSRRRRTVLCCCCYCLGLLGLVSGLAVGRCVGYRYVNWLDVADVETVRVGRITRGTWARHVGTAPTLGITMPPPTKRTHNVMTCSKDVPCRRHGEQFVRARSARKVVLGQRIDGADDGSGPIGM